MASAELSQLMSFDHVKAAVTEFARGFNHSYYQPLHLAILKGDWESTKAFLDNDPSALTAKVTILGRTALHVAAVGSQWKIVEKLTQHMPPNMLTELDLIGCTCLHYVAMGENIDAAKALVAKNTSLTQVTDFKGFTPLIYSITSTICKEMVWYLVLNTTDDSPACPFSGPSATQLVALLTATGFHDITMYILQRYPNLATVSDSNGSIILNVLSKLPSHFQSGHNFGFWKRFIYHCVPVELEYGNIIWNSLQTLVPSIKLVRDSKVRHVSAVRLVEFVCSQASAKNDCQFWQSFVSADIIFNATSSGIVEILRIGFQFFPDLVWTHIPNEGYVAQTAVKNRQEKVFSLLCKMPTICKMQVLALDESNNATSHLVARFASQVESIPGSAFQMQRELQWFKEVEKLDHPLHKEVKNQDGKTPWQVFKEEHKALLEEGKNWMKDTSNSCMLVATLIATIAFAAAITVPGGNNQDKGIPIFLSDTTFMKILSWHYLRN
ncbi:ankyrin repeat-containing protein [Trifolium pratense]|uniref:Ankyrin repeat-containing protein n=1 Tax=Trifolium pratense TaxID=57577 RepID=A0A2K3MRT4_TRIPR|nr:ankyrin repeat-containing protein [Trifolium pratense]